MSTEAQVNAIQRNLNEAKTIKELGLAVIRLEGNRDFLAVVKAAYFRDEAVRLVHLRGAPDMQSPERQASIIKQMDAIGGFSDFLKQILRAAEMAEKSIEADEAELDELRTSGGM